jgi:hypothetical protein
MIKKKLRSLFKNFIRLNNVTYFIENDQLKFDEVGKLRAVGGNLYPIEPKQLPNNNDRCVNFKFLYSDAYDYNSDGSVNTHLDYPFNGGYRGKPTEGANRIFVKLGWFKRQRLAWINNESLYHKYPIAFFAFCANILFGLSNVIFVIINFISFSKTDSSQLTRHLELEIERVQEKVILLQNEQKETERSFEMLENNFLFISDTVNQVKKKISELKK